MHLSITVESISLLSQEINRMHADICPALADPTRILILYLFSEKAYTVGELGQKLGASQPTTSRHLKILRERGLVSATRQAQTEEYALTDARII